MKHIIRLVTYGALVRAKGEYGRPVRAPEPVDEMSYVSCTEYHPVGAKYSDGWNSCDPMIAFNAEMLYRYRLVGIARHRYPEYVESRYERYL